MASDIPREIGDDETIVRVIIARWLKDGGRRIHRNAFANPGGVSVIRHDYKGSDFCKAYGKTNVQKLDAVPARVYAGLAAFRASAVRAIGSQIVDTREVFEGHADIHHVTKRESDNPPPADQLETLNRRLDTFLEAVKYFPDPQPECDRWTSEPVVAPQAA